MTKKTINVPLDDSVKIDEFDMDDPLGAALDPGSDRDPVTSITTGFLDGVKEAATSPSLYRQLVDTALPRGYKDALDQIENVAGRTSKLYNEVGADLAPTAKEFKRSVRSVKGKVADYLPKWLNAKIDEWTEIEESPKYQKYDPDQAAVVQGLADTFKFTQELENERQAREMVSEAAENKRFVTTYEQFEDIRSNTSRIAAYNDRVMVSYQRKSLELQYRQFFAARDLLEITKATSLETVSELRVIRKNTGLPEVNKLQTSELAGEMAREKLLGKAQDYLSSSTGIGKFLDDLFANIGNRISEVTDVIKTGFETGSELIDAAGSIDVSDLAEAGMDPTAEGAKVAGNYGVQQLSEWAGRKYRSRLGKTKPIGTTGSKLSRWANNADDYAREWADSDSDLGTIGGMFADFAKSLIPRGSQAYAVGADNIQDSTKPEMWMQRDARSLNEIIPGFLARILQSSEKHRLGSEDVPLLGWDHRAKKFATVKGIAQGIMQRIGGKFDMDQIKYRADELINRIDPNKELDEDTRNKLSADLFKRSTTEKLFDPAKLADVATYGSDFSLDQKERVSNLVRDRFQLDFEDQVADTPEAQDHYAAAMAEFKNLRGSVPLAGQTANMYANTGNLNVLRDLGIVKTVRDKDFLDQSVFLKKYRDYVLGENSFEESAYANVENSTGQLRDGNGGMDSVIAGFNTRNPVAPTVTTEPSDTAPTQRLEEILQRYLDRMEDRFGVRSGHQPTDSEEDSLVFHVDRIVNAVGEASAKPASENAVLVLNDILMAIGQLGQQLASTSGGGGDGSDVGNGWLLTGRAKRGIGKAAGFAWDKVTGLYKAGTTLRDGLVKGAWETTKAVGRFTKGALDFVRMKVIKDVYVGGEVRITAKGIREGRYFDVTSRKTIKTLKDVTGPVHDIILDRIVLDQEEFDAGLKGIDGKPIFGSIAGFLGGVTARVTGKIANIAGASFMAPIKVAKATIDFARETIFRPKDIYVPGEETPRILGLALARGNYTCGGKVVTRFSQIDGDVKGPDGRVVLTLEEMRQGVVDSKGKPINTLIQKATKLVHGMAKLGMGALGLGISAVRKSFSVAGSIMKGGINLARGLAPTIQFGGKSGGEDSGEIVDVLKRIYNLLLDKFGSDDTPLSLDPKAPEGSPGWWSNLRQKFKPKPKPTVEDAEQPAGEQPNAESEQPTPAGSSFKDKANAWWSKQPSMQSRVDQLKTKAASISNPLTGIALPTVGNLPKQLKGMLPGKSQIDAHTAQLQQLMAAQSLPNMDGVKAHWTNLKGKLPTALPNVDGIKTQLGTSATALKDQVMSQMPTSGIPTLPTDIGAKLDTLLTTIKGQAAGAKDGLVNRAGALGDTTASSASTMKDKIASGATDAQAQTKTLIQGIMAQFEKIARKYREDDADADDDGKVSISEKIADRAKSVRKGSWQDLFSRKDKEDKPSGGKDDSDKPKEEKSSILSKLLMAVTGIWGFAKGMFGRLTDMVSGFKSLRKLLQAVTTGKAAVDAADMLGGVDVPDSDGNTKKKGKLAKAKGALKTAGSWIGRNAATVGRGALAVGGALLPVAGAIASGIGAVVSSPVFLAGAAIVGTGAALYYGYKWLTAGMPPLVKVRMTQYGIPLKDEDALSLVGALEEAALKEVVLVPGGKANLSGKLDYVQWIEEFGLDPESPEDVNNWAQWFQNRFKPVFLTHVSMINSLSPGVDLMDIDDELPDHLKVAFAKGTRFKGEPSPYSEVRSPFPDTGIVSGVDAIDSAIAEVVEQFKDVKSEYTETGVIGKTASGATTATPTVGAKAPVVGDRKAATPVMNYVADGASSGAPMINGKSDLAGTFNMGRSRTIDTMASLRVKLYGLVELDVGRVNTLLALEQDVWSKVNYTPTGGAQYQGDANDLYNIHAPSFGGSPTDADHRAIWLYWFNYRFLPVTLNYYAAVKRIDRAADVTTAWNTMKKGALAEVGKAIIGSKATINGQPTAIWQVAASPFVDVAVNQDANSVQIYIKALEADAEREVFNEPSNVARLNRANAEGTGSLQTLGIVAPPPSAYQSAPVSTRKSMLNTGSAVDAFRSSNPTLTQTSPTSGSYSEVPDVTGSGTWDAVKNTLTKAAQIVGVDPGLLGTLARIESSFRPGVKSTSSSAAGLFQFIGSTWRGMMDRYADKYGIPKTAKATDPRAAALLAGEYVKENQEYLERKLGRAANATDIYASHFMGPGGSVQLLKADPNATGAELFPKAAASNFNIFYNKDGSPRSVAEIYQVFDQKVSSNSVPKDVQSTESTAAPVTDGPLEPTEVKVTDPVKGKPIVKGTLAATPVAAPTVKPVAPKPTMNQIAAGTARSVTETKQTQPAPTAPERPSPARTVMQRGSRTTVEQNQRGQQQIALSADFKRTLDTGNELLTDLVSVQREAHSTLKSILEAVSTPGTTPKAVPTPAPSKTARQAPKPPVDMSTGYS